ncbi:MAG TPA: CHAT domain-containing protein [Candidatus Acidoferrum sp.]|nr:CHAT domain-containing protein [Candidatus Acidoferrum sp.]
MVQGIANDYAQRFDLADKDLSEASEIARSSQPALLGDVSQARGNLEIHRKHYAEADAAFHLALSEARRQSFSYLEASTLGSLGYLALWQEHYDEAISWFRSSLEKSQQLGTAFLGSKIAGNMGWNYSVIGDLENAEAMFKQAEDSSIRASLTGDQVKWLNALSDVYVELRRYDVARVTSERALSLARTVGDNRDLTGCLNTLSDIALATSRVDEAEKYNKEALSIERAGLDQFGIASSTIIAGRIAAARKQYQEAEAAFQRVIQDKTVETPLRWQSQARLARAYADENLPAKAEIEFRHAINTFETARAGVHRDEFRLSFLSGAIEFYEAYVNFLIDQQRPLDALKIADLSRAQALEQRHSSPSSKRAQNVSFDPQLVARQLNATLLYYWLGHERSYLWVITPSKISILPLSSASVIEADLKSYRDTFVDPRDPFDSGKALGTKLYESLVLPAEKLIPKSSRVIILPDRSLNALNFETLIVSTPAPHYWIEDATISVANSLSLLARGRREAPPKTPNVLLFGDALFASKDFPVLPDSGKETDVLKKYFPDSRRSLFTKAEAKPSAYLSSNPGQFSYLHFATHGTASRLQPLESAIILSPEGDSFKLYARDIIQRPLGAYLVTISACNGAGVKVYAGEGLVGLAWAFLRAGAHNVIGGLWEVSNASTPQLMDELYRGLNKGDDAAVALRNAKLKFIHSQEYYRRPFYWAPFQLYSGS